MFEDRVNSFCWELVGRLTCVFVVPWGLPASEVGDLSDEPGNGYDRQTATDREFKCWNLLLGKLRIGNVVPKKHRKNKNMPNLVMPWSSP